MIQGCPIGIPKNPDISGSSRKEKVHPARAKYCESKVGGGGGSSRTQYEKICSHSSVEYRESRKCNGVGEGGLVEPSKRNSVDLAINNCFVRRLKQAIKIRGKRIFP